MKAKAQVVAHFGLKVRIKSTSKLFPDHEAVVAYVGDTGVSVYLTDCEWDDAVPLLDDEWEIL